MTSVTVTKMREIPYPIGSEARRAEMERLMRVEGQGYLTACKCLDAANRAALREGSPFPRKRRKAAQNGTEGRE